MADMRSIATAVEAYYVDYNNYFTVASDNTPHHTKTNDNTYNGPTDNYQRYSCLTTPVAYITSLPFDPFAKRAADAARNGLTVPPLYNFYTGNQAQATNSNVREIWALLSKGPDLVTSLYNIWQVDQLDVNGENNDWSYIIPYDPTNGTISVGDIARTGGSQTSHFPADFYREAPTSH